MSSNQDRRRLYGRDATEEEISAFNRDSDNELNSSNQNDAHLRHEVNSASKNEERQLKNIQIMDALQDMELPPRYLAVLQEQVQQMRNMRIALTVLGVVVVLVSLVMLVTFISHSNELAQQQALYNHRLLNVEKDPNAKTTYLSEKASIVSRVEIPGTVQFVNAALDRKDNTVYIIDPIDASQPSILTRCLNLDCSNRAQIGLTEQIQADSNLKLRRDNDFPVVSMAMDTSMGVILCLDIECKLFETATVNVTLNDGSDVQLVSHQVHLTSNNIPVLTAQDAKSNTIIVAACTDDKCTKVLISEWASKAGRTNYPDTMAADINLQTNNVSVAIAGSEGIKVLTCLTLSCHTAIWTDTGIEDPVQSLAMTFDSKNWAPVIVATYQVPAQKKGAKYTPGSRALILVKCKDLRCTHSHMTNLEIQDVDLLGLSLMLDQTTSAPLIMFDQHGPQLIACLTETCVGKDIRESLPADLLGYTSSFVNNGKTLAIIAPIRRERAEGEESDGSESEDGDSQQQQHAYVRIQNPLHAPSQ